MTRFRADCAISPRRSPEVPAQFVLRVDQFRIRLEDTICLQHNPLWESDLHCASSAGRKFPARPLIIAFPEGVNNNQTASIE